MNYYHQKLNTSIGPVHFVANETHLLILAFPKNWEKLKMKYPKPIEENSKVIKLAYQQLEDYIHGKRTDFDVPLKPEGTEFQKKVWQSLLKIPYGETSFYQKQAEILKMPLAIRAVARANGANPISIFLPCHRVVGKDGSLTGYAGGIPTKKLLLASETKHKGTKKSSRE